MVIPPKLAAVKNAELLCKSIIKQSNQAKMRVFKEKSDILHRKVSKAQLGRWDDFRTRKETEMRNFIFAVRRQKSSAFFILQIAMSMIFLKANSNLEHLKHQRKLKQGRLFVCAALYRYIKVRGRKYGPA